MNDKIKKIAKYTLNILVIVSALIMGINQVDGITIPYCSQIVGVIAAINGVISSYLLGQKALSISDGEDVSTEEDTEENGEE